MKRSLQIKIATALYEELADPGDCSYSRLAPIQKDIYERQARAAYKVMVAALASAQHEDTK